jgi:hypothetical protein
MIIEDFPNSIPITNIIKARVSPGRIAVPIRRQLPAIYKHVAGIPSHRKGEGLPLEKIRALDNLIDRLKLVKGERAFARDLTGMDAGVLDSLIKRYSDQLHDAVRYRDRAPETPRFLGDADLLGVSIDRYT